MVLSTNTVISGPVGAGEQRRRARPRGPVSACTLNVVVTAGRMSSRLIRHSERPTGGRGVQDLAVQRFTQRISKDSEELHGGTYFSRISGRLVLKRAVYFVESDVLLARNRQIKTQKRRSGRVYRQTAPVGSLRPRGSRRVRPMWWRPARVS